MAHSGSEEQRFQRILHHPRALTSMFRKYLTMLLLVVSTDSSSSSRAHLFVETIVRPILNVSTDSSSSSRAHLRTIGALFARCTSFNGFFIILARSPLATWRWPSRPTVFQRILHHPRALTAATIRRWKAGLNVVSTDSSSSSRAHLYHANPWCRRVNIHEQRPMGYYRYHTASSCTHQSNAYRARAVRR